MYSDGLFIEIVFLITVLLHIIYSKESSDIYLINACKCLKTMLILVLSNNTRSIRHYA